MNDGQNYRELYEAARRECENLKRKVARLERDKKYNAVMTQNIERMRDFNSAEKERQFLYNQLLLANCPDMIFVLDAALHFILGTEVSYGQLHYSSMNDLRDKPLRVVFGRRFPDTWITQLETVCHSVMEEKTRQKYNGKLVDTNGDSLHMNVTVSPAIDPAGLCMGVVVVLHDMTEINLLKEKAEQSSSAKSAFLANMSHEIRTPMNAIKGMADLMAATALDNIQVKYLANIQSASSNLLKIINDILDYSKLDAEKMELSPASYDSMSFVNDVAGIMNLKAANKGLGFVADIFPALPAAMFGDELRLKQVLLNLINNAIKFTDEGHVYFSIESEAAEDGNARLTFTVRDTGAGIREEDAPHMFNAFSRLDLPKNRTHEGTGLGLAISKHIVEMMGGELAVQTKFGEGSTFSFSVLQKDEGKGVVADLSAIDENCRVLVLCGRHCAFCRPVFERLGVPVRFVYAPDELGGETGAFTHVFYDYGAWSAAVAENPARFGAARLTAVLALQEAEEAMLAANVDFIYEPLLVPALVKRLCAGGNCEVETAGRQVKIGRFKLRNTEALVVDDNEINLIVCAEILQHYGIVPDVARSGLKACEMGDKKQYDIIFMDHMMPNMDGIETTKRIRQSSAKNKDTPIVALTANAIKGMRELYLNGGMSDYISKPIEISEIDRVLLRFLSPAQIVAEEVPGAEAAL